MDKLVAEFEVSHPGWGWLVRNRHGRETEHITGYLAHVMHPEWSALMPQSDGAPHFFGYGATAVEALQNAINAARMQ